jgi:hypothetical protein
MRAVVLHKRMVKTNDDVGQREIEVDRPFCARAENRLLEYSIPEQLSTAKPNFIPYALGSQLTTLRNQVA